MSSEQDALRALRILSLPPDSLQVQALEPDEQEAVANAQPWIAGPHVVGTGASFKEVAGTATDEFCLRIYVDKKLSTQSLPPDEVIPAEVTLPDVPNPIPTDVIEIGTPELDSFTTKQRPLLPGYSVGLLGAGTGTLGCFVAKADSPNVPLILSNSHVIAQSGTAPLGRSVIQPGQGDGGDASSQVGSLLLAVPFDFTVGFNNLCDAAIATVDPSNAISNSLPTIGVAKSPTSEITLKVGDTVQKAGRTTGYTTGVVQDLHFQTSIAYPSAVGGTGNAGFREQVLCSRYAQSGDSGSLICDGNSVAVGLHWLGSVSISVFSPIQFVFQALGIQLWQGVTVQQCQDAIVAHRNMLIALPGVQGLGVREPPMSEGPDCEVAVYVDTAENADHVPSTVQLDRAGAVVPIRVRAVVVGQLEF